MALLLPNRYPGKLIVVEGIDGSGKSTQLLENEIIPALRVGFDLVSRVVLGRGAFDFWESGMDLRFGRVGRNGLR